MSACQPPPPAVIMGGYYSTVIFGGSSVQPILFIIAINLLVFVVVNVRPDAISFLWLQPTDIWQHPWQLVTSMFTHSAFFHIFANMLTLYFFGTAVLQLLGERRFWWIYLAGGLAGGLAFVLMAPGSVAIGASGAVFALGGVLAVLRPNLRVYIFPIPVPLPLWGAVLGGFVLVSFVGNVAWQAHLGGIILGAAAGYYYRRRGY